jgi:L-iditol 2-dehydrogenase
VLKALHSVRIIAVDISDKRLAMAKQLGADYIFNARREDPVQKVLELVGSTRIQFLDEPLGNVDVAIDWAGVSMESVGPSTLEQALMMVKQNGVVVLGAVSEKPFQMDFNRIMRKGIKLFGSWGWTLPEYFEALELIGSGKIDRKLLVTHQFPLERAKEAYETAANTTEAIKVLIKP